MSNRKYYAGFENPARRLCKAYEIAGALHKGADKVHASPQTNHLGLEEIKARDVQVAWEKENRGRETRKLQRFIESMKEA